MNFLKKFIKNKMLVLSCCVIVVSLVYMGIQKAIDNYNFEHNNDIIVDDNIDLDETEELDKSSKKETNNELKENAESTEEPLNGDGEISSEEIDLVLEETEAEDNEEIEEANKENIEINKIYVYITGEVNNPGVVVLDEGSRIVDAINAAGGTTDKADISKVNLVYVLDDGMKVNIPNNNDLKNNNDFEYITMNSGDGGNDDYSGGTEINSENNTELNDSSTSSTYSKKYDIVNINTATQTELETLPGIGPSLALKIINHRKENGKFSSIEQIKDVSGIGESKYENLKKYITI